MKVLVFDDNALHRKAAEMLLKGHDVKVVATYDEAQEALASHVNEAGAKLLLKEAGYPFNFDAWGADVTDEARKKYFEASKIAYKAATIHPDFEVVMTDLMVPASRKTQGPKGMQFVGQEMPLGAIIALLALTKGVKMVAVVTDANHHDHPASAAFDAFGRNRMAPISNGVKILCTNSAMTSADAETFKKIPYEFFNTVEGKAKYPQQPDYSHKGIVHVKDWSVVLDALLGNIEID